MLGYLSLESSYSENRKVFRKGSLRKTVSFEDYVQVEIAEHNFVPNGGYCLTNIVHLLQGEGQANFLRCNLHNFSIAFFSRPRNKVEIEQHENTQ